MRNPNEEAEAAALFAESLAIQTSPRQLDATEWDVLSERARLLFPIEHPQIRANVIALMLMCARHSIELRDQKMNSIASELRRLAAAHAGVHEEKGRIFDIATGRVQDIRSVQEKRDDRRLEAAMMARDSAIDGMLGLAKRMGLVPA